METGLIDATPSVELLRALSRQGHPWHIILAELTDNALDAAANRVGFRTVGNRLEVTDDGLGCADMRLFFAAGARKSHHSTELGMFGIGCKEAFVEAALRGGLCQ
jgi:hypothetical protein